jgi:hypothetical protein
VLRRMVGGNLLRPDERRRWTLETVITVRRGFLERIAFSSNLERSHYAKVGPAPIDLVFKCAEVVSRATLCAVRFLALFAAVQLANGRFSHYRTLPIVV